LRHDHGENTSHPVSSCGYDSPALYRANGRRCMIPKDDHDATFERTQALQITGAAILGSGDIPILQRPWQMSAYVHRHEDLPR
jgi:hypothetical protein